MKNSLIVFFILLELYSAPHVLASTPSVISASKFTQPIIRKHGSEATGPSNLDPATIRARNSGELPYEFASYQSNSLLLFTVKGKTAFSVELDPVLVSLVQEKFLNVRGRWYHISHWSGQSDYLVVVDPLAKKYKKFDSEGALTFELPSTSETAPSAQSARATFGSSNESVTLLIKKDTFPDPNHARALQASVTQTEKWSFGNW